MIDFWPNSAILLLAIDLINNEVQLCAIFGNECKPWLAKPWLPQPNIAYLAFWLELHSTHKKRWLRRNDFEVLLQSGVDLKRLTRADIAEHMPNARFNTAYVYTILAHLGIIDN